MAGAMMRRATRAGAVLAVFFAMAFVSGCGGAGDPEPTSADEPPAADPAPTESEEQEPRNVLAECLTGTWQLDTADYLAQSTNYLLGLGVPLDALDVAGTQQLTFAADGYYSQSTDLTWTGSVLGNPISVRDGSLGEAEWAVEDDTLAITEWGWVVAPGQNAAELAPGVPAPSFPAISLEGLTTDGITCGDTLTLQAGGAPLRGVFVRFGGP